MNHIFRTISPGEGLQDVFTIEIAEDHFDHKGLYVKIENVEKDGYVRFAETRLSKTETRSILKLFDDAVQMLETGRHYAEWFPVGFLDIFSLTGENTARITVNLLEHQIMVSIYEIRDSDACMALDPVQIGPLIEHVRNHFLH